jgi:hypothetical protein
MLQSCNMNGGGDGVARNASYVIEKSLDESHKMDMSSSDSSASATQAGLVALRARGGMIVHTQGTGGIPPGNALGARLLERKMAPGHCPGPANFVCLKSPPTQSMTHALRSPGQCPSNSRGTDLGEKKGLVSIFQL